MPRFFLLFIVPKLNKPGTVIALSKANGFCNNEEFTSRLSGCLDCALEQEIWEYYQSGVSKAAEACDLDATPKSPTTSQEGDATTTAVSPSSVAETTDPVETGRTNEVNTSTLSYSRLGPANECVNGLTRSIKAINSLANNRPEHHASDSARVHRGRSPRLFSGKMVMQLSRWVGWSWCKLGS